jgi:hypothetical protein
MQQTARRLEVFGLPELGSRRKVRRRERGRLYSSAKRHGILGAHVLVSRPVSEIRCLMTTPEQFQVWLETPEGGPLEFKSARMGFHFDKLVDYCVAIANEGGVDPSTQLFLEIN